MKNTKGITLIALVITIIVLLILAGVSISMLSGDNSILNKGTKDKTFITSTFVTTANSEETIWKVDNAQNDGWPIFNEQ